jgi:Domain of unknown function (DUF5069)
MATDFRDGKTFPRRGRDAIGDALWLARITDKARAAQAGTIHDYIYPCPMDQGVLQRWGVSVEEFEDAVRNDPSDGGMFRWLLEHTTPDEIHNANTWLLDEKIENLNRQDSEEVGNT